MTDAERDVVGVGVIAGAWFGRGDVQTGERDRRMVLGDGLRNGRGNDRRVGHASDGDGSGGRGRRRAGIAADAGFLGGRGSEAQRIGALELVGDRVAHPGKRGVHIGERAGEGQRAARAVGGDGQPGRAGERQRAVTDAERDVVGVGVIAGARFGRGDVQTGERDRRMVLGDGLRNGRGNDRRLGHASDGDAGGGRGRRGAGVAADAGFLGGRGSEAQRIGALELVGDRVAHPGKRGVHIGERAGEGQRAARAVGGDGQPGRAGERQRAVTDAERDVVGVGVIAGGWFGRGDVQTGERDRRMVLGDGLRNGRGNDRRLGHASDGDGGGGRGRRGAGVAADAGFLGGRGSEVTVRGPRTRGRPCSSPR